MDIVVSEEQVRIASKVFDEQIGSLAVYVQLPCEVKHMIAAMTLGSIMHMSMEDIYVEHCTDGEFHRTVNRIVAAFEISHPDKANQLELLQHRVVQIIQGMDWHGETPPDEVTFMAGPPPMFDNPPVVLEPDPEFEAIVHNFYDDRGNT